VHSGLGAKTFFSAMPDVAAVDTAEPTEPAKAAKATVAMEVDGPETSTKAIGEKL
jgi:hypothetical protein